MLQSYRNDKSKMTDLINKLNSVQNVSVTCTNTEIIVSNSNKYTARFSSENVDSYQFVSSPFGDRCLKIDFVNNDFIIVTPDDFAFNTINGSNVRVVDLPPIVSINEMLNQINEYLKNPEPTHNIDNTIGLYLLNKQLVISAKNLNFDVDELLQKINEAAQKTSIGNLEIYN